jgi:hypothetical protein
VDWKGNDVVQQQRDQSNETALEKTTSKWAANLPRIPAKVKCDWPGGAVWQRMTIPCARLP